MNAYCKKRGLVISDWYFGERMETKGANEKVKKYSSKTVCTQSKWANEQTLKTELCIPI